MSRLPITGADLDQWGAILNDYLGVAHKPDGTAKPIPDLAYVEFTNAVPVVSTTEAAPTTVVTAPSVTFDGAAVWVEFSAPYANSPTTAASNALVVSLWDDTAAIQLGKLGMVQNGAASYIYQALLLKRRFTPVAGARVLSIRAHVSASTGAAIGAGAGGATNFMPAFMRVSRA